MAAKTKEGGECSSLTMSLARLATSARLATGLCGRYGNRQPGAGAEVLPSAASTCASSRLQ